MTLITNEYYGIIHSVGFPGRLGLHLHELVRVVVVGVRNNLKLLVDVSTFIWSENLIMTRGM